MTTPSVSDVQDTIIKSDMSVYDLFALLHYVQGVAESRLASIELRADQSKADLPTLVWHAARHGREELVTSAQRLTSRAHKFALAARGTVPSIS